MHDPNPSSAMPHDQTPADGDHKIRTVTSADLLRGSQELLIEHRGELYRLRLTRNDKLILTK